MPIVHSNLGWSRLPRSTMSYEEKKRLCETKGVTLNGKPAVISGAHLRFAGIIELPLPDGPCYRRSWSTVKRIVEERNGEFYT